jgi:hypothetical protein
LPRLETLRTSVATETRLTVAFFKAFCIRFAAWSHPCAKLTKYRVKSQILRHSGGSTRLPRADRAAADPQIIRCLADLVAQHSLDMLQVHQLHLELNAQRIPRRFPIDDDRSYGEVRLPTFRQPARQRG